MYQLYYAPQTASMAAHFLLRHMNLNYELILLDKKNNEHKSPEYLKINPAGRIPALVADGQAIFESPAICIHLCESHPESGLIPAVGEANRPLFFQWLAYLNNTLQTELMVRYYPQRHTTDEQGIPAVVAAQDERIAEALAVINDQLTGNQYLLGDQLSACDYFFFMLAGWATPVEKSPLTFPAIKAYLQRMSQLPVVKAVCDVEGVDLSPYQES
ncbi:glutathione S-transferase family protein [Vibrio quintilis]|uniref:Glutathione S-transferase GST-4.5 n=1 Tax=Vibrio quintilis TaxID=1117707 RepID=A0A1M7YQW3_9VIBR|nr:glutathione S-transferase family protein [Vibrio quintilis]SHO54990.1 Glutathione S-transferase GST-4.5 [Vibrio quintilis]